MKKPQKIERSLDVCETCPNFMKSRRIRLSGSSFVYACHYEFLLRIQAEVFFVPLNILPFYFP